MAERYTRVFAQQGQFYCPGSPVVIEAGALLKDNQTGKIIAQVKFKNISTKAIHALTVKIHAKDVKGADVEGIESFQYLDLNVRRDEEFGAKTPIPLPNTVARSFSCECVSAVLSDGSIWECEDDALWTVLPAPVLLKNEIGAGLAEQYKRDTNSKAEFKVIDHADLWSCSCGATNSTNEEHCHACRAQKTALLAALNVETLRANKKKYDEAVAAKQAELAEAERVRIAKNKKYGIIAISAVAILIALVLIITKVVIPAVDYKNANALLNQGEFIAAEEAFGALGDYKDSQTMVLECQYQQALYQIKNGNYDDAYKALRGLADYKDSLAQIRNSIFQRAKDHIEHKEYKTAYYLLEDMDNDPDAQEIILEGKLREANDYIQAGDYDRGYGILNSLGQADKVNESIYQRATLALTDKDYDLANALFVSLGDYEDSKTKALEAKYQKACDLLENKNYDASRVIFEELGTYSDSQTQVNETKYRKACDFLAEKNYDEANPIFEELEDYKDSKDKIHYHDYKVKDTKAASCTENGYNTYYCAGCQDGYTEQIKALGHDHKSTVTKEAACETQGICTYTCTRCSDSYTKPIDALGHNYSGATCTKASICSRCGSQEAPALGHTTTTEVCSRCNYNFTQPIYLTGSTGATYPITLPYGTYTVTITILSANTMWEPSNLNMLHVNIGSYRISCGQLEGACTKTVTFGLQGGSISASFTMGSATYQLSIVPVN